MKHTFFLIAFFSFLSTIVAQNDLVFNQVILLELSNSSSTFTVPEGKVWKVTYGQGGDNFTVNGEMWSLGRLGSHKNTPIWFPAGSIFTRTPTNGADPSFVLSILEFNLVALSSSGGGSSSGSGFSSEGLEFSNVINFESSQISTSGGNGGVTTYTAGNFTIPDGKVWKITSIMVTRQGLGSTTVNLGPCTCSGIINNTMVYDSNINFSGLSSQKYTPYWLTAGNHTLKISDNNSASATEIFIISYSAIEYNLPE
jgi:hypothetical protein